MILILQGVVRLLQNQVPLKWLNHPTQNLINHL